MKTKNMLACFIILLLIGGCASTPPEQMGNKTRMLFDAGVGYLNKGDTQNALNNLKEADRMERNNPLIHHALGMTYFQIGILERAETYLTSARDKMPNDPEMRNNLAGLYMAMGKYQNVITESTTALNNPDYRTPSAAFFNRGMAYLNLNQLKKAKEDFIDAIRREPNFDRAHVKLGKVLLEERNFGSAIKALNTALKMNEKNAEGYLLRGTAKWESGFVTDAENDFSMSLRYARPDSSIARKAKKWLDQIR